jgi:fatty acid amide hydrolase
VGKIYEYRNEWVKYWRAQQLDFVILPGFASEALNHGGSSDGSLLAAYTYIFNILGMVSAALPITLTRANELVYESRWSDRITDLVKKSLKDAEGMPVGIQVIGLPFSEEKVLGLSKRIEKHFKFSENHPLPDNP